MSCRQRDGRNSHSAPACWQIMCLNSNAHLNWFLLNQKVLEEISILHKKICHMHIACCNMRIAKESILRLTYIPVAKIGFHKKNKWKWHGTCANQRVVRYLPLEWLGRVQKTKLTVTQNGNINGTKKLTMFTREKICLWHNIAVLRQGNEIILITK